MSNQLQVSGEAKIRAIQGPVVANSGVITALDGDASEYVRGDGTLADFPTSTGGGSSVSYYLNTSVSQGTIGGVAYKQLSKTPISGAGTDITTSVNGYIASYITDANDPALLEVPAGNFNCEFYFSVNSNSHNPYVYAEVYKYDGTTFTLLGSNVSIPQYLSNGTTLSPYYFAIAVSTAVLTVTDRIAIRIYVNVDGRTVTLHTENNHLCQVVTTFSKGLISLNNLTRQNQFFGTGTSGTDFAISSATATHTFNLPVASASNTGKLSSTDWSTFNGKVPYTGAIANVDLGSFDLTADVITGATGSFTSSGAGIALNITKAGNNEGLYINKTSGSGNAATIVGTLEATTLVKTGGTSSQFLKADGTIDSSAYISLGSLSATSPIFYNSTTGVISSQAASATLEGYITTGTQTIAGLKTFSATLATNALIVSGQLTLYSTITNGSYTYTLPSATGTLALTSQIISISGTPNVIPRFNSAGTNIESGSILDYGTVIGTPPAGFVTVNARLTVNNYTEVNRYLSIIQNVDSSWALPSTGTSLEAFVTSTAGGTLITDTAYLRPRKASDDTFKRFIIQGDDLILNDTTSRRTLINKSSNAQTTSKLEVAGYARFDAAVNINSVLYFNATDSTTPTYLQAPSGNVTLLTTGTITLGTNSVSKFVFDVNGALNLGTSDNSNIININNQFSTLNSTLQGVHITPSILSASNSVLYTGVKSYPQFFLSFAGGANAYITHYSAINANNTANTANQIGVYIDNLTSVSGSYGIQSIINTATGSYNLYISGTAHNYLKGRLGVDQTNPLYAIDVTGDVNVTGNFKVNGTNLTQGVSGSGTQHYIPKFTSATSVGDSKIYQAPASGHLLVNTTYDYSASGGYLQVAGGFTTESFANIIYGSAPYVGNTVTLSLVNGNTVLSTGDRTYFIENKINTGSTSANYYLNYWNGNTGTTRYTLDHNGLHTFNNEVSISGATSIGGTLTGVSATFSGTLGITGALTGTTANFTGALNGTSATFTSAVTAPILVAKGSINYVDFLYSINDTLSHRIIAASYSATVPANNTLEFKVANQANGQATPLTLYGDGSSVFTNNLSIIAASNILLKLTSATSSSPIVDIELLRGTNTIWGSDAYTDYRIRSESDNLIIQSGTSGVTTTSLTIASTGATTFSSSLEAGKSGSLTVGDLFVDNPNKTVYVGRQSATGGDNSIFIVRNRLNSTYFYIDPSNDLAYFNNCKVGIGATTPNEALTIAGLFGNIRVYGRSGVSNNVISSNLYWNGSAWLHDNTSYGAAQIILSAQSGAIIFGTTGATSGDADERMRIRSDGNTTIGFTDGYSNIRLNVRGVDTSSSNFALHAETSTGTNFYVRNDGLINTGLKAASPYNQAITGRSAIIESTGSLGYLVSTRESKANIESIKNVDFINQLNPVQFNYRKKDTNTNEFTDELYDNITYGFIADEVEKVNKELVFYKENGSLAGVEYNNMIAILTKAIQELELRIKQLENK